jgi:hypothetical protein
MSSENNHSHNEKLNSFNAATIIRAIRSGKIKWVVNLVRTEETRNAYRIFVGQLQGKVFGRLRRRWDDDIQMDLP